MRNKLIFRNDEELNAALDNIYETYSKPPQKSEYIFVGVWLELLPLLGIIAYLCDISWLFYTIGGIVALTEVVFLFTGALRCLGPVLLIVSCVIGYSLTKSLLYGVLLGSCITGTLLGVLFIKDLFSQSSGCSTTTEEKSDL
jgi:hypothetical protein